MSAMAGGNETCTLSMSLMKQLQPSNVEVTAKTFLRQFNHETDF